MSSAIYARIKARLDHLGLYETTASQMAGLHSSTIRKIREGVRRSEAPTVMMSTLEKLAPVLQVSAAWLATGRDVPEAPPGNISAVIEREVRAGAFTRGETDIDLGVVYVPSALVDADGPCYAVRVAGSSMNRIFPSGSIAILERQVIAAEKVVSGQRYHVERQLPDGTVEHTLKRAQRRHDGTLWLVPESDDPAYSQAIPARGLHGEHVEFRGMVVCAIIQV